MAKHSKSNASLPKRPAGNQALKNEIANAPETTPEILPVPVTRASRGRSDGQ